MGGPAAPFFSLDSSSISIRRFPSSLTALARPNTRAVLCCPNPGRCCFPGRSALGSAGAARGDCCTWAAPSHSPADSEVTASKRSAGTPEVSPRLSPLRSPQVSSCVPRTGPDLPTPAPRPPQAASSTRRTPPDGTWLAAVPGASGAHRRAQVRGPRRSPAAATCPAGSLPPQLRSAQKFCQSRDSPQPLTGFGGGTGGRAGRLGGWGKREARGRSRFWPSPAQQVRGGTPGVPPHERSAARLLAYGRVLPSHLRAPT